MKSKIYSDEQIAQLHKRVNIRDIITEWVQLVSTGKNWKGNCPFHPDRTYSFMVNEEKQIFHCFACGIGGDVFTFLMKKKGLSFEKAISELVERTHLDFIWDITRKWQCIGCGKQVGSSNLVGSKPHLIFKCANCFLSDLKQADTSKKVLPLPKLTKTKIIAECRKECGRAISTTVKDVKHIQKAIIIAHEKALKMLRPGTQYEVGIAPAEDDTLLVYFYSSSQLKSIPKKQRGIPRRRWPNGAMEGNWFFGRFYT